jgi:hypothetical protein
VVKRRRAQLASQGCMEQDGGEVRASARHWVREEPSSCDEEEYGQSKGPPTEVFTLLCDRRPVVLRDCAHVKRASYR